MRREGFHPDYHDERFYQGVPQDLAASEEGESEPRKPPGTRLKAFRAGLGPVVPVATVGLVLAVGYAMLPTSQSITGRPATAPPPVAAAPPVPAAPANPSVQAAPTPLAAPTLGATATKVEAAPGPERALDLLGRAVSLPTRQVSVSAEGWGAPRAFPLPLLTVSSEGKVVSALPAATLLAALWLTAIAALSAGTGVRLALHASGNGRLSNPAAARLAAGAITTLVLAFSLPLFPGAAVAFLMAAALATAAAPTLVRLRALAAALGLVGAWFAASVPVVTPHAALAGDYGPLGLYSWDFAACLAATVAGVTVAVLARGRRRHATRA